MRSRSIAIGIISVSFVFVIMSLIYIQSLVGDVAEQEQKRMREWADATQMLIQADEKTDISFITSIIKNNTTIPAYMLDKDGNILSSRNVRHPIEDPSSLNGPIVVNIPDEDVRYIYYADSITLRKLRYFPYIVFSLILFFFAISVYMLIMSQENEQNLVWVGLCKETAHQLGTPISSLNAWHELLSEAYPDDPYLTNLKQDIERLSTVAERFSNIGSQPILHPEILTCAIQKSVNYMEKRVGNSVTISFENDSPYVKCMVNESLFSWVIENLIKNATDAMKGIGHIHIHLFTVKNKAIIDVQDDGMGIESSIKNSIFRPGFTTKQRGWGLGLSLCHRIIKQYHFGDIYVLASAPKIGTTIRIRLDLVN